MNAIINKLLLAGGRFMPEMYFEAAWIYLQYLQAILKEQCNNSEKQETLDISIITTQYSLFCV